MLKINTVADIGKKLGTGVAKIDGAEVVRCTLKFDGLKVHREVGDELLGMPEGWLASALYDSLGAPLRRFALAEKKREFDANGVIRGHKPGQALKLVGAVLQDFEVQLLPLEVLVSGTFAWSARGNEIEDVALMLGKECMVDVTLTAPPQQDLPLGNTTPATNRQGAH